MLTISKVKDIIGITERELIKLTDRSKFIKNNKFFNVLTHELTPIGNFNTPTIQELCNTTLLHGYGPEICYNNKIRNNNNIVNIQVQQFTDIANLQGQLKTSDKALVQVQSKFNCLQIPDLDSAYDTVIDNLGQNYESSNSAMFSSLAASLYRQYFNDQKQINLLSEVGKYFSTPINGNIILNGREENVFKIDHVYPKIRIGLHTDCAILYDRYKIFNPPYNVVDQVFSSSINLNHYGKHTTKYNQNRLSQTLLRAAYEGVYLAAILRKRKQLYLTLIGFNNYNNDLKIIVNEIKRAHHKYIQYSELEKVVIYEQNTNFKLIDFLS